jgi:hypothetical protein
MQLCQEVCFNVGAFMRLAAGLWKLLGKSSGFSSHGKLVGGLEPWIFFDFPYIQWPFQVPKLEVPKARPMSGLCEGYAPKKYGFYMIQSLRMVARGKIQQWMFPVTNLHSSVILNCYYV